MADKHPTQYLDSTIPGKAWAMDIYRSSRGQIVAHAVLGNVERRSAEGGVVGFSYVLTQAPTVRFTTGATRLTKSAYHAGLAMLLDKVRKQDEVEAAKVEEEA